MAMALVKTQQEQPGCARAAARTSQQKEHRELTGMGIDMMLGEV